MPTIYTCERCLKDFKQKGHYTNHLKRKNPCQDNKTKIESMVDSAVESKVENIIIEKKLISNNVDVNNTQMTDQTKTNYDKMSKEQLKDICRKNKIPGYSKLKKKKLVELVKNALQEEIIPNASNNDILMQNESKVNYDKMNKEQLKDICRKNKIPDYSKLKKKKLVELVKNTLESDVENIIIDNNMVSSPSCNNYTQISEQTESNKHVITKNIDLYIDDANNITGKLKDIDFIYMDPPYDTNRHFTLDSKSDKTGFTDKWASNNYELWLSRLVFNLKKTLSNKGTLVIHISSENSFTIEKILREKFKNIEKIYWKRCHGKNTVKKKFGAVIDVLFVAYDNNRIFNEVRIPIDKDSVWAFKNKDAVGNYSLGALKHDRTRQGHIYTISHDGVEYKNEYGWKLSQDTVEKMILENKIHFVTESNNMYVKIYEHEHKGKPLSNLWDDIHSITRTSKDPRLYPTQKPQKLLERLINIFTNTDSIVLDPVCGSGTTGFVADKLNRKCVLIDVNEEVLPIIKKRFEDKVYNI